VSESFERYARARDDIVASLDELRTILDQSVLDPGDLREVERELTRLRDGRFVLAVVGEFSSGKSFLLNALLGKFTREERVGSPRIIGLLATDINPSTATITELAYGSEEQATAH